MGHLLAKVYLAVNQTKNNKNKKQVKKGGKLHNKINKPTKLQKITSTLLIITITSGCTTNNKRDMKLIETLELQNSTIEAVMSNNSNPKNSTCENNEIQNEALKTIYNSNKVVINKLTPKQKKECHCGKNERTND